MKRDPAGHDLDRKPDGYPVRLHTLRVRRADRLQIGELIDMILGWPRDNDMQRWADDGGRGWPK